MNKLDDFYESIRQKHKEEHKAWEAEYMRHKARADTIAEIMAQYKSNGLLEIQAPHVKDICIKLGRVPTGDNLREVEEIGVDLIKIIEKK